MQHSILVDSAGTEALVESPPEETTIAVCAKHGIDISMHRGQQVTNVMVHDASIILCMAEPHRRIIRGIFPQWERKILLLKEFGLAAKFRTTRRSRILQEGQKENMKSVLRNLKQKLPEFSQFSKNWRSRKNFIRAPKNLRKLLASSFRRHPCPPCATEKTILYICGTIVRAACHAPTTMSGELSLPPATGKD